MGDYFSGNQMKSQEHLGRKSVRKLQVSHQNEKACEDVISPNTGHLQSPHHMWGKRGQSYQSHPTGTEMDTTPSMGPLLSDRQRKSQKSVHSSKHHHHGTGNAEVQSPSKEELLFPKYPCRQSSPSSQDGHGNIEARSPSAERLLTHCDSQQRQIDQCKALIRQQEMMLVKLRHQVLRGLSRSQSDTDSSQEVIEERQKILEQELQQIIRDQSKSITKLRQDSIKELTDLSPQVQEKRISLTPSHQSSQGWVQNGTYPRRYKAKSQHKRGQSLKVLLHKGAQNQNYPLDKSQSHDTCLLGVDRTRAMSPVSSVQKQNYQDHVYENTMDMCKPQRQVSKVHRRNLVNTPDTGGFSFQKYYAMYKSGSSAKTLHQRLRIGSYSADDILAANDNSQNKVNTGSEGLSVIHKPWSSLDNTSPKTQDSMDLGDYVSLTSVESLGSQKKSILSHGSYAKKLVNWDSSSFNSSDDSPFTSCDLPTAASVTERPLASSSPKVALTAEDPMTHCIPNVHNTVVKQKSKTLEPEVKYENFPPKKEFPLAEEMEPQDYDVPNSKLTVAEPSKPLPKLLLPPQIATSTPKRPDSLEIRRNLSLKVGHRLSPLDTDPVRHGSLKERRLQPSPLREAGLCDSDPQMAKRVALKQDGRETASSVKQLKQPSYKGWTRLDQSPTKAHSTKVVQATSPQKVSYQGWTRGGSERNIRRKDPMFEFPVSKTEESIYYLEQPVTCSNCQANMNQKCFFCRHKSHNLNRLSRRVSDPNLQITNRFRNIKINPQGVKELISSEDENPVKPSPYQITHKRSKSYDHVHVSRLGTGFRDSLRKHLAEKSFTEKPKFARQNPTDRLKDREEDFEYIETAEDAIDVQVREDKLQKLREDLAELTNIEEEMKVHQIEAAASVKSHKSGLDGASSSDETDRMNLFSNESRQASLKHPRKKSKNNGETKSSGGSVKMKDKSTSSTQLAGSKRMKSCSLM